MSTWWHWLTDSRRRLVAAIVAAVLIGLVLTPPVRAAVVEWLRIGGVLIKSARHQPRHQSPRARPDVRTRSLLDRAHHGRFQPWSTWRAWQAGPRQCRLTGVVSMEWGRPDRIHLDQFDGTISWVFVKGVWSEVTPTAVNGRDAAWIADTHEIVYTDRDGTERRAGADLWTVPRLGAPDRSRNGHSSAGRGSVVGARVGDRRIRTLDRRTRPLVAVYGT